LELFYIVIFVFVCLHVIVTFFKKEDGIFQAPFVACLMTLFAFLPQLITVYASNLYNSNIIFDLVFVMISCLLALFFGFKKNYQIRSSETIKDIRVTSAKFHLVFLVIIGIAGLLIYKGMLPGDWVVAGIFQMFGLVAGIISINIIAKRPKKSWFYVLIFIGAFYPIVDFALSIKGSRSRLFYVVLLLCYLLSDRFPEYKKFIKYAFIFFFVTGTILSASIVEYRSSLKGEVNLNEVDFTKNYTSSFLLKEISTNGMDLGNAALGIEYCKNNNHYSFGLIFIDRLIFNYIPARFVGEKLKSELMLSPEDATLEKRYTKGVTTMTGFYEAFNCFSYLGCLLFYVIGAFMKYCWVRAKVSLLYFLLYFHSIIFLNIAISHGLTYFFSNFVGLNLFIMPFLSLLFFKKRLIKKVQL